MSSTIYLDYNATTPLDPRVLEAMLPFLTSCFGNAASPHAPGKLANQAVENAREHIAHVLGADSREIYWTSGATESNNLALLGVTAAPAYANKPRRIVTVRTEHRAILDPCAHLETQGFAIDYLDVDRCGRIDLAQLDELLARDPLLCTIMHANNEIGVIHPIVEIGRRCRDRGVLFHSDASQTFGKEAIDVDDACVDLLSISGHKIYGPKGVGALYLRRRRPRVRCEPMIHGGRHERGLRSGTLNVPGIVGLGMAAKLSQEKREMEQRGVSGLRDRLRDDLIAAIPGTTVNGPPAPLLAGTLNLSFEGVDAVALMERMPELAISTASACSSALVQPSYVLGALGLSDELLRGSIRISLGRFTTKEEVSSAAAKIAVAVEAER